MGREPERGNGHKSELRLLGLGAWPFGWKEGNADDETRIQGGAYFKEEGKLNSCR